MTHPSLTNDPTQAACYATRTEAYFRAGQAFELDSTLPKTFAWSVIPHPEGSGYAAEALGGYVTRAHVLAAYYYPATAAQKARGVPGVVELQTLTNGMRTAKVTWNANSTAEARAIAAREGATPWNF